MIQLSLFDPIYFIKLFQHSTSFSYEFDEKLGPILSSLQAAYGTELIYVYMFRSPVFSKFQKIKTYLRGTIVNRTK